MIDPPDYDSIAVVYDDNYQRPVDLTENEVMGDVLRPICDGANILDLGCGTGLIRDLTAPNLYAGVDSSEGMLRQLTGKHPESYVVLADLNDHNERLNLLDILAPIAPFDAIVSLWSAYYFHSTELLTDLLRLLVPGGSVFLHGCFPRERNHYVFNGVRQDHLTFSVEALQDECEAAGLSDVKVTGWNAFPDGLAATLPSFAMKRLQRLSERLPARWSYHGAVTGRWEPDGPVTGRR